MDSKILSLIICYNNEAEVLSYCKMIQSLPNSDQFLIAITINSVSKNTTTTDFIEQVSTIAKNIYVYPADTNLGYLNGMVTAYHNFISAHPKEGQAIKWVTMGNTDITINTTDFVSYLLNAEYPQDVRCIAPKVHRIVPDCYEHQIEKRFKRSKFLFLYFVNKIYILSKLYGALAQKRKTTRTHEDIVARKIYAAHGCFFMIRADFMKHFLEEKWPFLMYNEEGYVSNLVYKRGYATYYDPHIFIDHQGSTTTRYLTSKEKSLMMAETYKYLYKQY